MLFYPFLKLTIGISQWISQWMEIQNIKYKSITFKPKSCQSPFVNACPVYFFTFDTILVITMVSNKFPIKHYFKPVNLENKKYLYNKPYPCTINKLKVTLSMFDSDDSDEDSGEAPCDPACGEAISVEVSDTH